MLSILLREARYAFGMGPLPPDPEEITPSGRPSGPEVAEAPHYGLNVGGSTPNYRVRINDTNYFVKELPTPADPLRELLAWELARRANVPSVPCRAVWVRHRTMAMVYMWFDGDSFEVLSWRGEDVVAKARALSPEDVARVVLFDFLVGHTDCHLGNYMVGKDGSLMGIDREQILGRNPMARGYTLAGYHRLLRAAAGIAQVGPLRPGDADNGRESAAAFPLPLPMVHDMCNAHWRLIAFLREQGHIPLATFVRGRGETLTRLAAESHPTVGDLDRLSTPDTPPPSQ